MSRSYDQHLDFDLDLAKEQSNLNPVYYIQYAHARISSVMKEMEKRGYKNDHGLGIKNIGCLDSKHESELISMLQKYPDIIKTSAEQRAVNKLSNYLKDIAQLFHSYYGKQKFVIDEDEKRNARVILLRCVSIVIKDGLSLLGVSAIFLQYFQIALHQSKVFHPSWIKKLAKELPKLFVLKHTNLVVFLSLILFFLLLY